MSLINCPECGHQISTAAIDCPNCGRPLHPHMVEPVTEVTAVPRVKEGFPMWAFIPLGILGALLLVVLFVMINRNDGEEANSVNVNISAKRTADTRNSRTVPETATVPPATETRTVTVPPSQTTTTTVPGAAGTASDRGVVMIDAKIMAKNGSPQAVRNEKFYLLDKDLEMILSEADLEPIDGQTLTNSLGMSVLYPDKYGDFHRKALNAINRHIKYSTQTDSAGKAQIQGVDPDSYYLFGITKTGKGFAVWSSSVSVNPGQNAMNLSPQPLTEMEG